MSTIINNDPVPGIPYFTPKHAHPPGTPVNPNATSIPTLFTPLTIREVTLRNRIIVAPMCQYSSAPSGDQVGCLTPYHVATLGHYALKGASLVFIEATGVQPNGRITPNCPGLWSDTQIPGVKAVADFVHSQGALCGMQLAHAGRKSSTHAPFVRSRGGIKADADVDGWPDNVKAPSGGEELIWDGKASNDETSGYWEPKAFTLEEIGQLVDDWKTAAIRCVKAGVDVIEIHGAHGYLIHQFLSPVSNHRTDQYGGSFENRTRIVIEIIQAIRSVVPDTMPVFLRISATEWLDDTDVGKKYGCWTTEDTIALSKIIADLGVDLLDVSSGGNHPSQRIDMFQSKDYQTQIAARIRKEVKAAGKHLYIGAVGLITEADQARDIVEGAPGGKDEGTGQEAKTAVKMTDAKEGHEPLADVILVARQFLREPEWVLKVAWKLGVDVAWPSQFDRVRFPKL